MGMLHGHRNGPLAQTRGHAHERQLPAGLAAAVSAAAAAAEALAAADPLRPAAALLTAGPPEAGPEAAGAQTPALCVWPA